MTALLGYFDLAIALLLKGTCQAEATSNSEKIKPIALAVIELRLSEGISQLLTQSVSQSLENSVKFFFF